MYYQVINNHVNRKKFYECWPVISELKDYVAYERDNSVYDHWLVHSDFWVASVGIYLYTIIIVKIVDLFVIKRSKVKNAD